MTQKIAYWINGLGEEMSSRVHSTFQDNSGESYIVVHDWREGTRGHGFVVHAVSRWDVIVREETPR